MENYYTKKTMISGVKQLTLLITLLLGNLFARAQAPDFAWAKQAQGNSYFNDERGNGIAHDLQGNSYVTGIFKGSITFGSITLISSGYEDVFVAKYDATGNILWAKKAGGSLEDGVVSIEVDGYGNCYIAGYFHGSATFGSTTLIGYTMEEVAVDFVAKLDASGNVVWAIKSSESTTGGVSGLAVDGGGNSYITGSFAYSATFGSTTLTSSGSNDVFVAKYNDAGTLQWVKKAGGANNDFAYGIAVDGNGHSFVTGSFSGNTTFGSTTLASSGSQDIFVARYDPTGNLVWAKKAGGSSDDIGYSISVDGSSNSYITGTFQGNANFGTTTLTSSGSQDVFIASYDGAGNVIWAKKAGSTGLDNANEITVNANGQSYITGSFSGTITFGSTMLTSSGSEDIFLANYDFSGNLQWAKNAGGAGQEFVHGLAIDVNGNSYVTGYFSGSATFGSNTFNNNGNNEDVFVAKFNALGNTSWASNPIGFTAENYAYSIGVDGSGNSIITGSYQGSTTFGSITLTGTSLNREGFIVNYNAAGNVVWAKKHSESGAVGANNLAVDASGNSYTTGGFSGNVTFGSTTLTSSGNADVFLVKYDDTGNVLWAKNAGGTDYDYGNRIAVDGSGRTYITGRFSGSATFGSTTLSSSGNQDVFVAKFDAAGNVLWAKQVIGDIGSTTSGSGAVNIGADGSGNSYITGWFAGSATFGSTTLTSSGKEDLFVAKYDASGNLVWAKKAGSTGSDKAESIAVYGNGDTYIHGWFSGSVIFGSTTLTGGGSFLVKYDPSGSVQWAKKVGGFSFNEALTSLAIDASGNLYTTGLIGNGAYIFGTGPSGNITLTGSGDSDIFVAKYDAAGNLLWAKNAGGSRFSNTPQESARSIAVDGSGNSYITGYFQDTVPFGSTTLTTSGTETFIAKIKAIADPVYYTLSTTISGSGSVTRNPNQPSYLAATSVQVTATPAAGFQFTGWSGDASGTANPLTVVMNANKNITATFVSIPGVMGFNLINAISDQPIQPLVSGAVLNLAALPTRRLNIQAVTNPPIVGSVFFNLSGQQSKSIVDNSGPHYSLQGDKNGNYSNWTPPEGTYTLMAKTYAGANGTGSPGGQQTITFTVIDNKNAISRMAETGSNGNVLQVKEVYAYPNPFKDKLMLELTSETAAETAKVTLNAIDGKTVYQKEVKLTKGRVSEELDGLSGLPAGMYFLRLQLDEKPILMKVMKQ